MIFKLWSPEVLEQQQADCLKVIEAVLSGLEPEDFKKIPADIKKEPETKEGEDMRTCFKRLLSGYCRCNGLKNAVEVHRGEVLWEKGKFEQMNSEVAKDLLKNKGKAFKKALLEKINPIMKEENKTQVMTKAFASRVWKCIVYYCDEGKFPEVSLLERKNVFDDIRRDGSFFLKNDGNGDCGVISVLQGNALVNGSEAYEKWSQLTIQDLRQKAYGELPYCWTIIPDANKYSLTFLEEDAEKWNAHTKRINDLEKKSNRNAKESELITVSKNVLDELERNFTQSACRKRILADGTTTAYKRSLLPDDFRWFAKACEKTILLVVDGIEEPLINLYFRDGTQLSDGMSLFENLFTKEEAKKIVCIYTEPRRVNSDDGNMMTHYKAFTDKGRKALFNALGYRKNNDDELVGNLEIRDLMKTFVGKELDLTGGSNANMKVWEVEKRMRARVLFECDPAGFTEACFTNINPSSVKFPSYRTYGTQQAVVLKELSATEEDYQTELQWEPSLSDDQLEALNKTFGEERQYLKRSDGSLKFETVGERIDRWADKKLYTPSMTEDGVLDWSKEPQLVENLKKASHGGENYFYNLLKKYIKKEGNAYMCGGKVVKTIDCRGLEELVFSEIHDYCAFWKYVLEEYPGITFRVLPSYRSKESRQMKVTARGTGENQWSDCIARTEEEIKTWDETHLPTLKYKRLHDCVSENWDGRAMFEDLNTLDNNCFAKDLVLLVSEQNVTSIDFSLAPFNANKFKGFFKTKDDLKHFGLLGRVQLWIPKSREDDFNNSGLLFERNKKHNKKTDFISISVLPQAVGIRFIKEEIETKKEQNDWEGVRLVWNSYARYLFGYAGSMANNNDTTGCEIFADKVAEAAKEQKLAKVCVDLSDTEYSEAFGNMLVPALSERGIDVLIKESRSKNCLNDFKNKGRNGIRGLYKDVYNDIWFLPGADLNFPENKTVADNKAKTLLDKKNAILQQIQTGANADLKLSKEMFSLATVKEIFDALEKNPKDGTVTLPWRKNHPSEADWIA